MKEIVKVLLQEGIEEETIHEVLDVLEKWGEETGGYEGKLPYKDVKMSPDEYIKKASRLTGSSKPSDKRATKKRLNKLVAGRKKNSENIKAYASKITSPTQEIDKPYLSYAKGQHQQEGIHRALAAKDAGEKEIPVRIFHSGEKKGNIKGKEVRASLRKMEKENKELKSNKQKKQQEEESFRKNNPKEYARQQAEKKEWDDLLTKQGFGI